MKFSESMIDKLKSRWGINSSWQILIIMVVFACTGFTALYVRQFVFALMGIEATDPFWFRALIWLLTILPAYHVLLLAYGALFGQFDFFWGFSKKMMRRFVPGKTV